MQAIGRAITCQRAAAGLCWQVVWWGVCSAHQSLAAVGVAAFSRLVESAGASFLCEHWQLVADSLMQTSQATLPGLEDIITPPSRLRSSLSRESPGPQNGSAEPVGAGAGHPPRSPPLSTLETRRTTPVRMGAAPLMHPLSSLSQMARSPPREQHPRALPSN